MQIYLRTLLSQLRKYSATLDKTSILIDKPWALIDDELELQKLIFKKNKELILSKNGQVQIGKWDYFPEAKSLLIDRNTDKILCNEAFIDNGVMVLKLDGTDNKLFILANENIVPDLDVLRYLKELHHLRLRIFEKRLVDGRKLEIQRNHEYHEWLEIGQAVSVDAAPVQDGHIKLAEAETILEVKGGKIFKILSETIYVSPDNKDVIVQQQYPGGIRYGDYVFMSGKRVENAIINFSKNKNLIVVNGIVERLESKNRFFRWFT